jgi:uroporphyrinogen decarboxylase
MEADPDIARLAAGLVAEAHAQGGLAPVDLERFWADQDRAARDPFDPLARQVPLGPLASHECVFSELGLAPDWYRLHHDPVWRAGLCRAYNDQAERIVGRRVLADSVPDPARKWPAPRTLADLFEARDVWHHESYWLMAAAHDPEGLAALLDRVERRLEDPRAAILPAGWEEAAPRLRALGVAPPRYRFQRGPVTFATSIYGAENLLFLILDQPELAVRLRDVILRAMLTIGGVLDAEAGDPAGVQVRGFQFNDDNCCLLTPAMYEFFALPILQGVFARWAPGPGDRRFQHSDSAMGHLLPLLARCDLTGVNFGPTLRVREIRAALPRAVIHGQLAPFTYSRHQEEAMVAEFLRDRRDAEGTRGLLFTTAGSVNDGSRLIGMRLLMAAAQRWGW